MRRTNSLPMYAVTDRVDEPDHPTRLIINGEHQMGGVAENLEEDSGGGMIGPPHKEALDLVGGKTVGRCHVMDHMNPSRRQPYVNFEQANGARTVRKFPEVRYPAGTSAGTGSVCSGPVARFVAGQGFGESTAWRCDQPRCCPRALTEILRIGPGRSMRKSLIERY